MKNNPFPSYYEEFIHKSRYARWIEKENRREDWDETVKRYFDFMFNHIKDKYGEVEYINEKWRNKLESAVFSLEVMPSMRSVMTAGKALARDNVAGYNCSYLPIDDVKCFDEAMYILLCGTGVGFSVEKQYVNKLPEIPDRMFESATTIVVSDSKEGWAKAFRQLVALLYTGEIPRWDTSKVRPSGAKLKTFGGRASGPEPLEDLFHFTTVKFKASVGRKLTPLECHDILCKVGEVVVVGGVRRSAMISLSDLSDTMLAKAKSIFKVDQYSLVSENETHWVYSITMKKDQPTRPTYTIKLNKSKDEWDKNELENNKKIGWWHIEPQRALANNSVSFGEKPSVGSFMSEWLSIYESNSGERGIFNRQAAQNQTQKYGRRESNFEFGTNPCSEIILRPYQFCNLSEMVIRSTDTFKDMVEKAKIATILGTFQSTLTHFPYLRKVWIKNTEEERLLGVSMTGIMDHPATSGKYTKEEYLQFTGGKFDNLSDMLEHLRKLTVKTNKEVAEELKINPSTSITCVKPSGTVGQLVNSASGIHARHSEYYIRTVRGDVKDPLTNFLKDSGVPCEPDVMKPDETIVFSFPMKAPADAVFRTDLTAVEQLELWKIYQEAWCEHKPSVTISVKENEWPEVGGWVFNNFDLISGVSFLPFSDHVYRQAPYQDCTKEEYEKLLENMPKEIVWQDLSNYEIEDTTAGMQTLACSADGCEVVDIS